MRKIRLRKKYKMKKSNIIIIIITLLIITIFYTFKYLNNIVSPILINYAEVEIKRFSNLIVNKAISNYINDDINVDNLFIITRDGQDEIKTIDFNPIIVNKLLTTITDSVHVNLKNIIRGNVDKVDIIDDLADYDEKKLKDGIIFEIPAGVVFKNPLLSNIGPKIPVRLNLNGEVISNINTKVTNYGINNALMEVSVNIELSEQVILPFLSKKIDYNLNVPIAIKMIQGTVPNYFFNGITKSSPNISLPIE